MAKLKTVNIKGKEYVPVNERLKFFRAEYPKYSLLSEIVHADERTALVKAKVCDEGGRVLAEGTAFETAGSSNINQTSHVENCETSAWGRALANFGIGIDASVATADEVANAVMNQGRPAAGGAKMPPAKPAENGPATEEQVATIRTLVNELGRDEQKMWEFHQVPDGKPTFLQAATILGQLLAAKRGLSKQLDAK